MGGLEVVRNLRRGTHIPVIVIVTAYDKYALQAFEAVAIDYLLKPIRAERLAEAVKRAKRVSETEAAERLAQIQEIVDQPGIPQAKRIVGKIGEEYFLLNSSEIYAFQADGDNVSIFTAKKKYLATHRLKALEERRRNTTFRRIHRNALVNVEHVRKMSALSSQRWLITLANGQEFIASRRQAGSIRQLLSD